LVTRGNQLVCILISICLVSFKAYAIESTEASGATLDSEKATLRGEHKFDQLTFTFGQENYVTERPLSLPAEYTEISAHIKARTESDPLNGVLELGGSFSTDVENYSNIEAPEAYLDWHTRWQSTSDSSDSTPMGVGIDIGRKKELWSYLDSEWALGLSQPLNKFDALRTTEQGLTGAFVGYEQGKFQVLAFASALFIPEQGPSYQLQNGDFSSNSPWFQSPPSTLILFGKSRPVHYTLNTPAIGSIVNHLSGGGMIRYGGPHTDGFFAQLAFLKKPRNDLNLPFDGHLALTGDTNFGDVTVYPKVVFHNFVAADVGYVGENWAAILSGAADISDPVDVDSTLTYQKIEPLYLMSPTVEYQPWASEFWGPKIKISYLHSVGGDVSTVGPLATNGNVFGARLNYREALSIATQTRIVDAEKWKLDHGFRWIEETAESGTILMTDLRLSLGVAWRITLSGDLLGSKQPETKTNTFISRFRGNDRYAARVTYIF
jgi:hypothetical protein